MHHVFLFLVQIYILLARKPIILADISLTIGWPKSYLFEYQAIALAPVRLYLQHAMSLYNRFYASYQGVERVIGIRLLWP